MLACGSCRMSFYCSKPCQVQHWPIHKLTCKELRKVKEAKESTVKEISDMADNMPSPSHHNEFKEFAEKAYPALGLLVSTHMTCEQTQNSILYIGTEYPFELIAENIHVLTYSEFEEQTHADFTTMFEKKKAEVELALLNAGRDDAIVALVLLICNTGALRLVPITMKKGFVNPNIPVDALLTMANEGGSEFTKYITTAPGMSSEQAA